MAQLLLLRVEESKAEAQVQRACSRSVDCAVEQKVQLLSLHGRAVVISMLPNGESRANIQHRICFGKVYLAAVFEHCSQIVSGKSLGVGIWIHLRGRVHRQFFTQGKNASGKVHTGVSQNQIFGLAYHSLAAAGIDEADYIGMDEPIQGPDGYKAWNTTDSGIYKGAFVISANCKQPEMLVKWIDNLYTYEGSLLINFGKEGEDWHYNEQHLPTWNDYILDQVNENTNYDLVTAQVSCYASGNVPCWFTDETFPGAQCRGLGYETSQKLAPYTNQQAWLFNFTIEEAEEVSALKADINTNCHDVWRADFIKGTKDVNDDAVWNEYVQQIESLGLEDMMYLYQTALDRMLETK